MILTMIMVVVHSVCIYVGICGQPDPFITMTKKTQNGQKSRPISYMARRHMIDQNYLFVSLSRTFTC